MVPRVPSHDVFDLKVIAGEHHADDVFADVSTSPLTVASRITCATRASLFLSLHIGQEVNRFFIARTLHGEETFYPRQIADNAHAVHKGPITSRGRSAARGPPLHPLQYNLQCSD